MARANRREVLSEGEIQVVHCVNRCVRRGFLCGVDELTGKNYEHRRQWMRNRLEFLAGIFAVDVLGFSVMSNHLHVILRSRPDILKTWSDEEVARRWWSLFPQRRNKDGSPAEPAETDLTHLTADAKTLAELRARLSSISWFMRCTSEVIARMANAEDECTGRFWEGRFKATVLPDEAAIAASVDFNPIRAGLAANPEQSHFTIAQERIADLKSAKEVSTPDAKDVRIEHGQKAGWLAPVELEPKLKKVREKCSSRRASNKGCVFMTLTEYLQLLDWPGRQLKPRKLGAIPKERSTDSGPFKPVRRTLAARRRTLRQTPLRQSCHASLKIQRDSKSCSAASSGSVGRKKDVANLPGMLWFLADIWMAPDGCADWTGRQLKPGKRGAIPKSAPPILDRLNLSAELWLHAAEHFGKRRATNRVTPASRFNATANPALQRAAVQ